MNDSSSTFHLQPWFFTQKEHTLLEHGSLSASAFRFESGVAAIRLRNELGELVMLPYQGQQIWSAEFGGRNLTMKSMFDEPQPTQTYLETYGAFLIHCGFTSMGVPTAEDSHPLHGELPNACYREACLVVGEDETGPYLALGGRYRHTVAFSYNYVAEPLVTLRADSSRFNISLGVTNLKRTPMEYMYLAHVNFRPVNDGRLIYSAPNSAENIRVRSSIPSHITPGPGYIEFIEELKVNPDRHHVLRPELAFDPEIVFFIDYQQDTDGWAHSLQVHPDGSADYIAHRPEQLDVGVRWISRTPDQDALGILLPATAEPEGYAAEKAKGNVKVLDGGATWRCDMIAGTMTAEETQHMAGQIGNILA
jgi:hypothetical protein